MIFGVTVWPYGFLECKTVSILTVKNAQFEQTESEFDETNFVGSGMLSYCYISSFVIFRVRMWPYVIFDWETDDKSTFKNTQFEQTESEFDETSFVGSVMSNSSCMSGLVIFGCRICSQGFLKDKYKQRFNKINIIIEFKNIISALYNTFNLLTLRRNFL